MTKTSASPDASPVGKYMQMVPFSCSAPRSRPTAAVARSRVTSAHGPSSTCHLVATLAPAGLLALRADGGVVGDACDAQALTPSDSITAAATSAARRPNIDVRTSAV